MMLIKVTVTLEDESGVFFDETIEIPREELIAPGMATPGMKSVAEALLKVAQET
jgi:hypothetical protein